MHRFSRKYRCTVPPVLSEGVDYELFHLGGSKVGEMATVIRGIGDYQGITKVTSYVCGTIELNAPTTIREEPDQYTSYYYEFTPEEDGEYTVALMPADTEDGESYDGGFYDYRYLYLNDISDSFVSVYKSDSDETISITINLTAGCTYRIGADNVSYPAILEITRASNSIADAASACIFLVILRDNSLLGNSPARNFFTI